MDEIEALKNPIAFSLTEVDHLISPKQLEQVKAIMKKKDGTVPCEFKQYPNTVHGGLNRPNLADPQVKAGFEGAFAQAVSF
ncbi:hypothetical protein K437DRAFT_257791 [Tilletiaria anomala UBC 951]|uniref:Dienelactone hydrolase domain-containing protein n=1 Tax=Tilletiaria anomala (strain ATCC 24038 / CBS 436.72 / UBC 951) TaxID=1037660 RepID=A0A066VM69_TILAU|nr:uncharacterized protein K437DRAFT_257791 [Tilletiaria anomala UBC 951]KDN42606.1 hypothetical protein K437DRAFT_257791 [Tilletiaria anomala UBC 951]